MNNFLPCLIRHSQMSSTKVRRTKSILQLHWIFLLEKNTGHVRHHEPATMGAVSGFCFDENSSEPCSSDKSWS